eukprot:CAMPEP_0117672714 /NCGR_PEP_ID=MMETSP0804-20121206/14063_1 /TAXON_ID=1074897 /ORGANISM="Tetraselmis astigmatica, Strain CCMP880" /LENGTH=45 /DNA_ID= /DNA_START= /DNA_END= /DNA_ORIENTATION=
MIGDGEGRGGEEDGSAQQAKQDQASPWKGCCAPAAPTFPWFWDFF